MASRISIRLMRWAIQAYRVALAPMFPTACKHFPSCSRYAEEAIVKHGPIKGALLSAKRVLRCHPFSHGGYDPVPGARDQSHG